MQYTVFMTNPAASFDADDKGVDALYGAVRGTTNGNGHDSAHNVPLQVVQAANGKLVLVNPSQIVAIVAKTLD